MWTLRDRAHRAEAEQALRVEQGKMNERARIAREMHDVLAHRISLIAMHAGALTHRKGLTPEQMRAAEIIQVKAHEALTDLRQVLGVLRHVQDDGGPERPQPTFTDLSDLIHEAEESGMRIQCSVKVAGTPEMPEQVGRAAYRIVQEGLTNARKHAPGVTVLVRVAGGPREGISINIRNPARSREDFLGPGLPGSRLGLVGLKERASLAGGDLSTRRHDGTFELTGWLPWTA